MRRLIIVLLFIGIVSGSASATTTSILGDGANVYEGEITASSDYYLCKHDLYYFEMFDFIAPESAEYRIEVMMADFDPELFVGEGLWSKDAPYLAYNDDQGPGQILSRIDISLEAGLLYWVEIDTYYPNEFGAWKIEIEKLTDVPPEVPVPAAIWLFASAMIGILGVKSRIRNS